jgi:predicted regulator of Ras-like GTPase activity (Roadblock/LC7/MglB family)
VAVAEKALAELTDISSQVQAAVLFETGGKVLASTLPEDRAEEFAAAAKLLLDQAEVVRDEGDARLNQLEVATGTGSVFVVREGERVLAAVTSPNPTAGLVFYDLRACLRGASQPEKPKRRRAPAKKPAAKKEKADGAS